MGGFNVIWKQKNKFLKLQEKNILVKYKFQILMPNELWEDNGLKE